MSISPVPLSASTGALVPAEGVVPAAARAPEPDAQAVDVGSQVRRVVSALNRFKWVTLLTTLLGLGGGILATRLVTPVYLVGSTVLITSEGGQGGADRGPIRQEQAFDPQGWMDLLRTFSIADSVVMRLALYLEPARAADLPVFRGFQLNPQRFAPGEYTLSISGARYTLHDKFNLTRELGIVGDSVGRTAGFLWAPSRQVLGGRDRTIEFTVRTPRETSVGLLKRLQVGLARGSGIIVMQLTGTAQQKPAETLNAWGEQFVRIATGLKTERVALFSRTLAGQRAEAAERLAQSERAFTQFRIGTIALPSDALAIQRGPGGGAAAADPVMSNYFQSKYQLESLRRDRAQLERAIATPPGTPVAVDALLSVPLVASDPGAVELRASLSELVTRTADVRALRNTLTDSNPVLRPKLEQLRTLQQQTVPNQARAFLAQLRQREAQLGGVVSSSTSELQAIPSRTTQQEALRREMEANQQLFTLLESRYREAQLAEQSMTPDVKVLDRAVMPLAPTENTAPKLIALALAAGLGLGLALSVLLDRLDSRFRYPSQVTHELGLQVLGVVPQVDQSGKQTPEQTAQIVEAFRAVRMNVRYACMPAPRVTLTVTSPSPHDGKSLIASNLALSFAEGGFRTVLVDGDLRRGQLHVTFGAASGPGLVEYLEGTSLLGEVLQGTSHENLAVVATGAKHKRGPELLGTPRMQQLLSALAAEFDVIIIDSPPLGAGTDAYALGAATGNVAVVLRSNATDMRMAKAKLGVLDQLPVRVIGAVLNEVRSDMFGYMAYDPDYLLVEDEERAPALPAGRA